MFRYIEALFMLYKKQTVLLVGIMRENIDRWIPDSIMQVPVSLDSGFFRCEFVVSTALNDELIVSATTHWVAVFWATTSMDPWSWPVFWFCFFSGVSPTAITPVILLCCFLINKYNKAYQTGFNLQWTYDRKCLLVPLWWLCVDCVSCDVLRCCR